MPGTSRERRPARDGPPTLRGHQQGSNTNVRANDLRYDYGRAIRAKNPYADPAGRTVSCAPCARRQGGESLQRCVLPPIRSPLGMWDQGG
jgi:hypothetical protein